MREKEKEREFRVCLTAVRERESTYVFVALYKRRHSSVTRFAENSPLWQTFYLFGNVLRFHLELYKILNLLWEIFLPLGIFFIAVNGQILSR